MADFASAFNPDNYYSHIKNDNQMDYFFTQRKIIEYEDYIDDKDMTRKKKKISTNYNFLAINLPFNNISSDNNYQISIEIWGDKGYHYNGIISNNHGTFPHLLIRLNGDTQIFVKILLQSKNEEKVDNKNNFINFIQVPKRYQLEPSNKEEKTDKKEKVVKKNNKNIKKKTTKSKKNIKL